MKDKPTAMTAAPNYVITIPASWAGPMSYAPPKGFKSAGKVRRFTPALEDVPAPEDDQDMTSTAVGESASTPPSPSSAYKENPIQRRTRQRMTALHRLLYSIKPPPPLEAFLWFDNSRVKWKRKDVEDVIGGPTWEWHMKLNGKKPDLGKLRKNLSDRFSRKFPEGYFLYRWKLEYGRYDGYGEPVLHLHLIGDPGPGHTLEAVTEHLTEAWLTLTGGDPGNRDLVRVQATHEGSRGNFCKRRDDRLASDLERLLGGPRQSEFGKFNKDRMPTEPRIRVQVTDEQLKEVLRIVAQHHMEYEGLLDAVGTPTWDAWARSKFLRMLSDANYGTVFLNEVTGPQVRAVLGLE